MKTFHINPPNDPLAEEAAKEVARFPAGTRVAIRGETMESNSGKLTSSIQCQLAQIKMMFRVTLGIMSLPATGCASSSAV